MESTENAAVRDEMDAFAKSTHYCASDHTCRGLMGVNPELSAKSKRLPKTAKDSSKIIDIIIHKSEKLALDPNFRY